MRERAESNSLGPGDEKTGTAINWQAWAWGSGSHAEYAG